MTNLNCSSNSLTSLNVKNGSNSSIASFNASSNSDLKCIQADATTSPSGWTKDTGASYSKSCVYWNGTADNDWATAGNWDGSAVPTSLSYVIIQASSNNPRISGSTNPEISDIIVNSGATLTINGGSLRVNNTVSGNITYNTTSLSGGKWYLVSSPVTGQNYSDTCVTNNIAASTTNDNRGIATYSTSNDTWSYM